MLVTYEEFTYKYVVNVTEKMTDSLSNFRTVGPGRYGDHEDLVI